MQTKGDKLKCYSSENSFLKEMSSKPSSSPRNKNLLKISKKLSNSKLHSRTMRKETKNKPLGKSIKSRKLSDSSCARSQSSLKLEGNKTSCLDVKKNRKNDSCDIAIKRKERRKRHKRKKKKNNIEQDEAVCLQRRARNLLIKMKLELNFVEAYSADGWKGQSKEKIKPENELQRAGKQILKCKLGIRATIRQLDLLSAEDCIADGVIDPDGSVFHEHIFCAKCKLREAFPDNDIILCDGNCNCAFHQKCLEPPSENIPPADQGWLCKICECKLDILEAINAHIGTSFTVNNSWEDIFKEETTGPCIEKTSLKPDEDWPSEDSNDEDYDPELVEDSNSRTVIEESMCDGDRSSCSLYCSSDELSSFSNISNHHKSDVRSKRKKEYQHVGSAISIDSDGFGDCEIPSYCRERKHVDYQKLHDEMFGKDFKDNEQQSEDEDWGPQRRKRRRRELDADSMDCGDEDGCSNMMMHENVSHERRKLFRIPHDAVEKLRQVFAKNELPSRAIKENLAAVLGISAEKVSKWFKNARYAALRIRKVEMVNKPQIVDDTKMPIRNPGKQKFDREASMDSSFLLPLSSIIRMPRNLRKVLQKKNSSNSTMKMEHGGEANAVRNVEETFYNKGRAGTLADEITENEQLLLVEIERLFSLEERLQNLKNTLLTCKDSDRVPNKTTGENVMYVPVVVVKEKPIKRSNP